MAVQPATYPVTYAVDYPSTLSRWLWLFKWILLIPHYIVLAVLGVVTWFTLLASWVAIVITGKNPRGLWDFHLGVLRWSSRVNGYAVHLVEGYPGFSMQEEPVYPVRFNAVYVAKASRLTTFFRVLLAIPHWIVLGLLGYVVGLVWLIHIIVVIFTGKPNDGIYKFIVGYYRWQARVNGYYWLLTDKYPPFSLD